MAEPHKKFDAKDVRAAMSGEFVIVQFQHEDELLYVEMSPTLALDLIQELGRALAQHGPKLTE